MTAGLCVRPARVQSSVYSSSTASCSGCSPAGRGSDRRPDPGVARLVEECAAGRTSQRLPDPLRELVLSDLALSSSFCSVPSASAFTGSTGAVRSTDREPAQIGTKGRTTGGSVGRRLHRSRVSCTIPGLWRPSSVDPSTGRRWSLTSAGWARVQAGGSACQSGAPPEIECDRELMWTPAAFVTVLQNSLLGGLRPPVSDIAPPRPWLQPLS